MLFSRDEPNRSEDRREFLARALAAVSGPTLLASDRLHAEPAAAPLALLAREIPRYEQAAIRYFEHATHENGMVCDRVALDLLPPRVHDLSIASIAAVGYALAGYTIAVDRGFMKRATGAALAAQTVGTLLEVSSRSPGGWLPHFLHCGSLQTCKGSEHSTIDTVLCLLGALAAGEYFGGPVKDGAKKLFDNLDFELVRTNGGKERFKLLYSHGFMHQGEKLRFLKSNWGDFSEGILVPLLSLGTKEPIAAYFAWSFGWSRNKGWEEDGLRTFGPLPLFTYYRAGAICSGSSRGPRRRPPWNSNGGTAHGAAIRTGCGG
jgi:hypothetical protein